MIGRRPPSLTTFQRSEGGVCVPSVQTRALMVPPAGGNNFGVIPPKLYGWFGTHVSTRLSFLFYKERLFFNWCFFKGVPN